MMERALIAFAGLLIAGGAVAEPPRPMHEKPVEAQKPAAPQLASAEPVQSAPARSNSAPAKRHVTPRVTTCRCSDQQPDAETDEQ